MLANDCTASVVKRGCLCFPLKTLFCLLIFAKKALLVLFLICECIEHTSYTNTLFRYLCNIVSFTYIFYFFIIIVKIVVRIISNVYIHVYIYIYIYIYIYTCIYIYH